MKKYLLQFVVINSILLGSIAANAQMVGTDVFLKGKYVEVGIGHLGYYGSDSGAPADYHPHMYGPAATPGAHLGFVADIGMDGWTVGTPAYMGDYFYPGSPFEGWELQVDGPRCQGYDGGSGFSCSGGATASGSNLSYSTIGSKVIGIWQGVIDSVQLTQITSLDTNALYFTVKIILTNLAVTPKNNIYYWRSVDPDNDESWPGGGFDTKNIVEHQSTDTTVVSATGYSSDSTYLALGTTDTAATAVIYNSWGLTAGQDLSAVYNRTYGPVGVGAWYDVGWIHPGDIAIGLVMYVPHLATVDSAGDSVYRTTAISALHPANTATISYFYAFSRDAVNAAIQYLNEPDTATGSTGGTPTLGVKNVNNTPEIKVYPNPAKNIINVTGLAATDQLSLYDMMGRAVNQNWITGNKAVNTFSLNNIPAGAYILMVEDANGNMKARMPIRKQ